jgi:hypothetical protein
MNPVSRYGASPAAFPSMTLTTIRLTPSSRAHRLTASTSARPPRSRAWEGVGDDRATRTRTDPCLQTREVSRSGRRGWPQELDGRRGGWWAWPGGKESGVGPRGPRRGRLGRRSWTGWVEAVVYGPTSGRLLVGNGPEVVDPSRASAHHARRSGGPPRCRSRHRW